MRIHIDKLPDGKFDVSINCPCGKPITHSDEYGMECDDKCSRNAFLKLMKDDPSLQSIIGNGKVSFL